MESESYIAEQFRKLVKKYEADKAATDETATLEDQKDLLNTLVTELVAVFQLVELLKQLTGSTADDNEFWYQSSANY